MKRSIAQRSVKEIADSVEGKVVGDGTRMLTGIADLRIANEHQLAFFGDSKYLKAAQKTNAGAMFVPLDSKEEFPTTVIQVKEPAKAFAKAAVLFMPAPVQWTKTKHPTAVISPKAKIGDAVHIGPHTVIEAGAHVGDGSHIGAGCYIGHNVKLGLSCFLHPNVVIEERCTLGNRVIVHAGTVIGSDGFGYEFTNGHHEKIPQIGYVQIDDDVEIGANVTIDRGRFDKTWIQEGCKIDNLVMIAHNVVIGKHTIIIAQSGLSGSVHVGNYVIIAGQSGIAGHLQIGDKAIVTARAGVTRDCEPGKVYSSLGHARERSEIMRIEAATHQLPQFLKQFKDKV
ncbi:MAG: UDP-3-O-(3-hydroxymyristoyl)glucosamine N-acyltransferase [Verrucomicrobiota bacterium]